ncbi:MAG: Na+/H+ antiporter NhaC family protein, partial [Eubacteriales bacterium]|nr:Na+/H+ antiporter NhaC family protein [Eubacteriales bacterium]
NILTMCLVFLTAGAFSGAVSAAGGADSTVNLFLTFLPPRFAVAGLFLIACFVSISMGTSVGTISALAPFAVSMSQTTGFDVVLCIAAVASGAMFGDNLSMISDTTIAAVRTQGCEMKDKFRMNFFIALPAAVVTFVLFLVLTPAGIGVLEVGGYDFWKVMPYLVVLIGAIIGINVFLILIAGSVLSLAVGVASGAFAWTEIFSVMGTGVQAMYDITVISIVVACIGALVREYGGIAWLISFVRAHTKSQKGAQLSIGALVAAIDVATANNTVAIVMTGPLAKDISTEYDIDPRRTASLLDIFASVMQGILPFGAQLLYASAGAGVSAVKIVPYMFYCYLLAAAVIVYILFWPERNKKRQN